MMKLEKNIKKLISFAGKISKKLLLSAGTEATEAAFKLMRIEWAKNIKKKSNNFF